MPAAPDRSACHGSSRQRNFSRPPDVAPVRLEKKFNINDVSNKPASDIIDLSSDDDGVGGSPPVSPGADREEKKEAETAPASLAPARIGQPAINLALLDPLLRSPMGDMVMLTNIMGVPAIHASFKGALVRMRGITKLLKSCFYPNYRYDGNHNAKEEEKCAKEYGYDWLPPDRKRAAAAKRRTVKGKELGTAVDYQLRLFANAPAKFEKMGSQVRTSTKDMITAYVSWDWHAVASQYPIAAPDVGIGTCVDMIAVTRQGEPVLIENKTGFDGYMHKHTDNMRRRPLLGVDNRPLHQHFLQLIIESLIIKKYYGLDFGARRYVVQASTKGVIPFQLPAWFVEMEEGIWTTFVDFVRTRVCPTARQSPAGPRKRPRPRVSSPALSAFVTSPAAKLRRF